METPVQVSFQGLEVDDAVARTCQLEAEKLERYHARITSCRVVVAQPHHNHRQGNNYEVRIDVHVPGRVVVVNHEPGSERRFEDVQVALRDAFDKARRQLEDLSQRRSGGR
jgi:ribosomal subunit interface protein